MTRVVEWERRYERKLLITDVLIAIVAVGCAQFMRYGIAAEELQISFEGQADFQLAYSVLSALIILGWVFALTLNGSREPQVIGTGPTEYARVFNATLATFGLFAILAFALKAPIGRGYMFIALPLGLFLLLLSRWLWRKRLHSQRSKGKNSYRTLIVGDRAKSRHVAMQIMRSPTNGFHMVGAATEANGEATLVEGVQVIAGFDDVVSEVDRLDVDTVILSGSDKIEPQQIREIGWQLEARGIDLIVAAALTDVAGPRIHTRPVAGLPLIHVEFPTFSGPKHLLKRIFDIVGSAFLLIVLSPVLLIVALAVKLTSSGPIFYFQERVGVNGKLFPMFKFRSMVVGADDQLKSLLDAQGTSEKPLHKIQNDPRITPVGRFIRKYSLDELPQLLNVFLGSMSLVGPRPQREAEVALYKKHHFRRLLVKPGITGLWQVSGRSDIEWDDAIRLDLYYVENWTLMGDIVLLWRTVRAVARPDGAY